MFLQYLTPSETRTLNKEVSGVSAERFTKVLVEQQQDRARREQERIRLLTADPFDLDAQAKIEEDIRYRLHGLRGLPGHALGPKRVRLTTYCHTKAYN